MVPRQAASELSRLCPKCLERLVRPDTQDANIFFLDADRLQLGTFTGLELNSLGRWGLDALAVRLGLGDSSIVKLYFWVRLGRDTSVVKHRLGNSIELQLNSLEALDSMPRQSDLDSLTQVESNSIPQSDLDSIPQW